MFDVVTFVMLTAESSNVRRSRQTFLDAHTFLFRSGLVLERKLVVSSLGRQVPSCLPSHFASRASFNPDNYNLYCIHEILPYATHIVISLNAQTTLVSLLESGGETVSPPVSFVV